MLCICSYICNPNQICNYCIVVDPDGEIKLYVFNALEAKKKIIIFFNRLLRVKYCFITAVHEEWLYSGSNGKYNDTIRATPPPTTTFIVLLKMK